MARNPRLSIIVPVRNEAAGIVPFLRHVREQAPGAEIIVVDGGSTDGTPALISEVDQDLQVRVLRSEPGRARQMNAGAAAASGDWLWFLHADSLLPDDAAPELLRAAGEERLAGGCFRIRFPETARIYRISDSLGNLGVDFFHMALGDHGIFCRGGVFREVGGYPEVPLMEDAELYRRLRSHGRVRQLRPAILTSARRYQRHGPYRTTAVYALILLLYFLRVPPVALLRIHRRCLPADLPAKDAKGR